MLRCQDVPNLVSNLKQGPKVCGCCTVCFSCSPTSTNYDYMTEKSLLHWKINYEASTYISNLKSDLPIFSYGCQKCIFVDSLADYISLSDCVQY